MTRLLPYVIVAVIGLVVGFVAGRLSAPKRSHLSSIWK